MDLQTIVSTDPIDTRLCFDLRHRVGPARVMCPIDVLLPSKRSIHMLALSRDSEADWHSRLQYDMLVGVKEGEHGHCLVLDTW